MVIASILYPRVVQAFHLIELDNGMVNRLEPLKDSYIVPTKYFEMATKTEAFLGRLEPEELEEFCVGSYDEQLQIRKRNPEAEIAAQFLDLFFNEWNEDVERIQS